MLIILLVLLGRYQWILGVVVLSHINKALSDPIALPEEVVILQICSQAISRAIELSVARATSHLLMLLGTLNDGVHQVDHLILEIILGGLTHKEGPLSCLPLPPLEFHWMQRIVELVLESRVGDCDHHVAHVLLKFVTHVGVTHYVIE
jgi:hypothetical protein